LALVNRHGAVVDGVSAIALVAIFESGENEVEGGAV